jgi:ABC-type antimicrobial peptide transport system permease subunit
MRNTGLSAGRFWLPRPQRIVGGATTAGFLSVLGIRPVLGRFFTAEEDRPGAPGVAVLTYSAWRQRFGGDPTVVGRDLTVFLSVPVVLFLVALSASFMPARRAAKVDPIAALRCE